MLFFPACFCIGIGLGKELLFKTHIVRNAGDGTFFHIDEQKNIRHTGIEAGNTLRGCPAYILLYQFSPKDTGQSKVK